MFSGYLLAELDKPDFPQRKLGKSGKTEKWSSWKYFVVIGLLITNIPAALYTSLVHQVFVPFWWFDNIRFKKQQKVIHVQLCCIWLGMCSRQRGSEAVMVFLAREADEHQVQSVTFLMQCHATPYYASLHRNLTMRFLDCSPRWGC
jgi:phosphatidylinositol glycan class B